MPYKTPRPLAPGCLHQRSCPKAALPSLPLSSSTSVCKIGGKTRKMRKKTRVQHWVLQAGPQRCSAHPSCLRGGGLATNCYFFLAFYPFFNASFLHAFVPQGASALFDMIEYYESATHLNISFNKHIGTRGWQAAAHMMRKVRARSPPLWAQVLNTKNKIKKKKKGCPRSFTHG